MRNKNRLFSRNVVVFVVVALKLDLPSLMFRSGQ